MVAGNLAGATAGNLAGGDFSGVLDGIAPANLVAAYSTARRLLSSYSGALVEVRETGGDTDLDIGYLGSGLIDTSALTTHVGANDGAVNTLYDQSGNSRDMAADTDAEQPLVASSGTPTALGSYVGMAYDGSNDEVKIANILGIGSTSALTIAWVAKAGNLSASDAIWGIGATAAYQDIHPTLESGQIVVRNNTGTITFADAAVVGTDLHYGAVLRPASCTVDDQRVFWLGSELTATGSANGTQSVSLGAAGTAIANTADGALEKLITFGEWFAWDKELSAAEMTALNTRLSSFWGV